MESQPPLRYRKLRVAWSVGIAFAYVTTMPGSQPSEPVVRPFGLTDQQFWLLALPMFFVAALPWIRWSKKFSLRTLLIATTLVAIILGIITVSR